MCTYTAILVTSATYTLVASCIELGLLVEMYDEIKDYETSYSEFMQIFCLILMAEMVLWIIASIILFLSIPLKKSIFVSIWKLITLLVILTMAVYLIGCFMDIDYQTEKNNTYACFVYTCFVAPITVAVYLYAGRGHDGLIKIIENDRAGVIVAKPVQSAPPLPALSAQADPYPQGYPQGSYPYGQSQYGQPQYPTGSYPAYTDDPAYGGPGAKYIPEEDAPPPRTYGSRMGEEDDFNYNVKRSSHEDDGL